MNAAILLAERVSDSCRESIRPVSLRYRPDLAGAGASVPGRALAEIEPAIVASQRGLDLTSAASRRTAVPSGRLILVCESLDRDYARAFVD